jgi:AcrR family transcriptional regulator
MRNRAAGVRQLRRDDVTAQILRIGRAHLARHGAAALSLRAVARDLGMVSSAVYRYVSGRDDLLTLLVVDAYSELADAVDAAVRTAASRPWSDRVLAAAGAIRGWALRDPARYALLYGSPVPGYTAPPERTTEPGTRVIGTLLALVAEGVAVDDVADGVGPVPLPAGLRADLVAVAAELHLDVPPEVLARAVMLWSVVIGAVSLEVFGQYGQDTFAEPGLLFEHQIASAVAALAATTTTSGRLPQPSP